MTTLLSWVSYSDSGQSPHLPRAVYVASDSRITWGASGPRWENGRKVFASFAEPHLFAYCGDVVLPALILGQIVSAIDTGLLFAAGASADERHDAVAAPVDRALAGAVATPTLDFTIHHVHREYAWPETKFRAWNIQYEANTRACKSTEVLIPGDTQVIASLGSGNSARRMHLGRWDSSDAGGTSRAILSSFCDSIRSGIDPWSGGPPQLGALYTNGSPAQIGMYIAGRWFLNGLDVGTGLKLQSVEWRDALGQRIDSSTAQPIDGARKFFRPASLAK